MVQQAPAETAQPSFTRVQRLRRWCARFLKGVAATWTCTFLLAFQAAYHDPSAPVVPHPLERLLAAGGIRPDATSVTVVSELVQPSSYELGAWKHIIRGVTGVLPEDGDAPERWELFAEADGGYRFVRYEGRGSQGTHWVVSAYQLRADGPVYVSLRAERRGWPEDLRLAAYELRRVLHAGVTEAVRPVETRIVVTGTASVGAGRSLLHYAESLLGALGYSGGLHVREEAGALWVAAASPFLAGTGFEAANVELQLVPEGERLRVTVGTPRLGQVESSLLSGYPPTYTLAAAGHTMGGEVR